MREPSLGGRNGELAVPRRDLASPGGAPAPGGPNPSMPEATGRLPHAAGPMGKFGIGPGLPAEREAAR